MIGSAKVRRTIEDAAGRVTSAAENTRTAIITLGAGLVAVALAVAVALILAVVNTRRLRAIRAQ